MRFASTNWPIGVRNEPNGPAIIAEGELRAEIAAAYMLAELGVPQSSDLSNHQAYLKNWLQALRNDNRFIFKASTAANKAADYRSEFPVSPNPN